MPATRDRMGYRRATIGKRHPVNAAKIQSTMTDACPSKAMTADARQVRRSLQFGRRAPFVPMASRLRREAGYQAGQAITCLAVAARAFFSVNPTFAPFVFTDRPINGPGSIVASQSSGMKRIARVHGVLADGTRFTTFCPTSSEVRWAAEPLIVTFNAKRTSFGIKACDEAFLSRRVRVSVAVVLAIQSILALIGSALAFSALAKAWKAWRSEA